MGIVEGDKYDTEPFFIQDRLPPFNILIQGSNEGGHIIEGALFGVELLASGLTLSIDDLFTEQQYTYVARWMLPFTKRARTNSLLSKMGRDTPPAGAGAISGLENAALGDLGLGTNASNADIAQAMRNQGGVTNFG